MTTAEEINLGEPAYKVGSLFKWDDGRHIIVAEVFPIGKIEEEAPLWEWNYKTFYLQSPVRSVVLGEMEMRSLLTETILELISKGGALNGSQETKQTN